MTSPETRFKTFEDFWPFYMDQHRSAFNRGLHALGTSAAFLLLTYGLITQKFALLVWLPVVGYLPPWIGHFVIEKNRPATFTYPLWSLRGDFRMLKHMIRMRKF